MDHERLEQQVREIAQARIGIQDAVGEYVVGNRELVDLVLIGILTGGHVLIDGVPGTAKTTISKIVARLVGYQFTRVQGAVDVQPADVLGVRIFDAEKHEFVLQKGPIFSDFVMIDEMNRLTPKTQSAFIEAMAERQATIDGITYPLGDPYFVVATQNTQEFEGTFPLIEAQRDRFNYSMTLYHLDSENESEILKRLRDGHLDWDLYGSQLTPVLSIDEVREMGQVIHEVYVDDAVVRYIRDIVIASRVPRRRPARHLHARLARAPPRGAGPGRARRPDVRHPRRRQDHGPPGPRAPARPGARGRDRPGLGRPDHRRHPRDGRGGLSGAADAVDGQRGRRRGRARGGRALSRPAGRGRRRGRPRRAPRGPRRPLPLAHGRGRRRPRGRAAARAPPGPPGRPDRGRDARDPARPRPGSRSRSRTCRRSRPRTTRTRSASRAARPGTGSG